MLSEATISIQSPDSSDNRPTGASGFIQVEGLGKRYKIYATPWDRMVEWASLGSRRRHQDFWALRDISFTLTSGESLGIIGVNGSGKSTLLKILTGCSYATEGRFKVSGRILSLLELGTGLNPLLTGRQNVTNSAQLLALPSGYAAGQMPAIESFAELGEFFDRPVRMYSTGMIMRLAFSIFVALEPDVFIVDEALSVGDIFFQQKCVRRMRQMRERGTTLLFVSHDLSAVEKLCDRVLVLHKGQQQHLGDKIKGFSLYYALSGMTASALSHSPALSPSPGTQEKEGRSEGLRANEIDIANQNAPSPEEGTIASLGETEMAKLPWSPPDETEKIESGHAKIDGICLRRMDGVVGPLIEQGQDLDVFVRLRILRDIEALNVGISIYDRFHQLLFSQGWINAQMQPLSVKQGQTVHVGFRVRMDLAWSEEYVLAIGAAEALRDGQSPTGWDQNYGGVKYVLLPRCAVVTIAAPANPAKREWFGPANLQTSHRRTVSNAGNP